MCVDVGVDEVDEVLIRRRYRSDCAAWPKERGKAANRRAGRVRPLCGVTLGVATECCRARWGAWAGPSAGLEPGLELA